MPPKRGISKPKVSRSKKEEAPLSTSEWRALDAYGPQPTAPAELFVVQGRGIHRIRTKQIVSLRPTDDPNQAEWARSFEHRKPLVLNAGTPSARNPDAGACFRNHAFAPKREEVCEVQWADPPPTSKSQLPKRCVNPSLLTPMVSGNHYCSAADVLARYAGGAALEPSGAGLFLTLFLNEGDANVVGCYDSKWMAQRQRIGSNLSRLFLIYPKDVPPVYSPEHGHGLLACLASICSDKSEGAPGAVHAQSIAGYHDRCRLHLLSPTHARAIERMVEHYQLEASFPQFAQQREMDKWPMSMEEHRYKAIQLLGAPRAGIASPDWLHCRSQIPFDTPWVVHCSMTHPQGERDVTGRPVLVPLVRGGAEERNGSPWLYLNPEDATTEHYHQVKRALASINGTDDEEPKEDSGSDDEEPGEDSESDNQALLLENAQWQQKVETLKADLVDAKEQIAELTEELEKRALELLDLKHPVSPWHPTQ